jgi:DinB superfamily
MSKRTKHRSVLAPSTGAKDRERANSTSPSDGGPAIAILLRLLDEAFDQKAWHGPNLRGSIRRLEARQAGWRPSPDRHNIWEIVVHAAYWKYVVWRQLSGGKRGGFELKGSNWFARPQDGPDAAWRDDVALLVREHRRLVEGVAGMSDRELDGRPLGKQYDRGALIRGAACHDLYHTGQIQLLKKLCPY